ncbi:hydroxyacid oxidase 1 [Platysternon megacephalum]|uniref:Hydroxyacid oxidase 1 n=1 Tax=Platysternon megacephalum TaxID=55544 RepID=A0A4D9EFG0_9SAUR|nr:hydroxyacid oxidase 1 [Platysternon megacephalum]
MPHQNLITSCYDIIGCNVMSSHKTSHMSRHNMVTSPLRATGGLMSLGYGGAVFPTPQDGGRIPTPVPHPHWPLPPSQPPAPSNQTQSSTGWPAACRKDPTPGRGCPRAA